MYCHIPRASYEVSRRARLTLQWIVDSTVVGLGAAGRHFSTIVEKSYLFSEQAIASYSWARGRVSLDLASDSFSMPPCFHFGYFVEKC
jgi:hypothetical protein